MPTLEVQVPKEPLLANFPKFFSDFRDSLARGYASQVLEHDDAVHVAITLGKVYSLYSIVVRSKSDTRNVAYLIARLHEEYKRIHGEAYHG